MSVWFSATSFIKNKIFFQLRFVFAADQTKPKPTNHDSVVFWELRIKTGGMTNQPNRKSLIIHSSKLPFCLPSFVSTVLVQYVVRLKNVSYSAVSCSALLCLLWCTDNRATSLRKQSENKLFGSGKTLLKNFVFFHSSFCRFLLIITSTTACILVNFSNFQSHPIILL